MTLNELIRLLQAVADESPEMANKPVSVLTGDDEVILDSDCLQPSDDGRLYLDITAGGELVATDETRSYGR